MTAYIIRRLLLMIPTIFGIMIIRPDGVIDSVLLTGHASFPETMEEKKSELL